MWGAEAVVDSTVQAFFALILAWMLYRGERKLWILGLAVLPVLMDSDHLLPLYAEGIKAFHSMLFVYFISGVPLAYGYIRNSDAYKKLGITAFAILMLSLSMDLLEGGKIAFMYPLSAQAYALPYFGAYEASRIGVILMILMIISGAYYYENSLDEKEHHAPEHHPTNLRVGSTGWAGIHHANIGSEAVLRVTALLASLITYITIFIVAISR
jgi:hypothetical protein